MSYVTERFHHVAMTIQDMVKEQEPTLPVNFRLPVSLRKEVDAIASVTGLTRTAVLVELIEGALPDALDVCRIHKMTIDGKGVDDLINVKVELQPELNPDPSQDQFYEAA